MSLLFKKKIVLKAHICDFIRIWRLPVGKGRIRPTALQEERRKNKKNPLSLFLSYT